MPFVHGKSTAVFLGGTDVSSFLNSVDQTISRDVSETSVFGAQAKSYLKGHKDGTISLSGYWDGAANAIDAVMANALGNVMNGYGSELLPAGDAVADYTAQGLAQNIQNPATPLPGFVASVEFINNSFERIAAKTVTTIAGTRYLIEVFIQMTDTTAPVFGGISASVDASFLLEGTIISTTTNVSIQLISGSLYKASMTYVASGSVGTLLRVTKHTGNSAKAFRIAGLSLRPAASVTMARTVDTYGPELLAAGDALANYSSYSVGVANAATPLPGFTQSIQIPDNSTQRWAYKTATFTAGVYYLWSLFVQMDDSSIPTPGGNTSDADFRIELNDVTVSTRNNTLIRYISGSLYQVSLIWRSNVTGTFPYNGIGKVTINSAKTFRMAGMSLRAITQIAVPTAPALSICEAGASTVGNRCLVVQAHDTSYQVTSPTADTVAVSAEFQVDGSFGSGAFRGVVLAANTTYSSGTNTASVDNGATTFGGLVANFHVLDNSGFVTMKIQHSTDNSTWVDLLTSTSFVQSGFEHRTTPNVVYRYLRVNITSSGSPRLVVTAARK